MTGYNGNTITSDTIGNMLSDGTWTYTWEHGRQLAAMSSGSTTWTYTYNADGLRTKRTNGSTTYSYIYNGSSLSQMAVGSDTLYFAYDAFGTPMSVTYNGTNYYYATNVQGDVTAILNTGSTAVVTYTYDAWGNILSTDGSMASTLGAHNPLRYRGYVYDADTGLYYLQSRYYDPEMGRFINADAYASTGQGLLGNNMFAYCGNNPISREDAAGQAWLAAAAGGAIAGGLIGAASYLVSNGISGDTFDICKFGKAVGIGALNGAIGGVAGTTKLIGKAALSLTAGAIVGIYTAINTEGTIGQKMLSGVLTGAIAVGSTFVGASIDTGGLSPLATTFANYGTTIAVATPAEFAAVAVQTAINTSSSATMTASEPTLPKRNRPRNYVALYV